MRQQETIKRHQIELLLPDTPGAYPIYYLFAHQKHDAAKLHSRIEGEDVIIAYLEVVDWNDTMTPWPQEGLFRSQEDFGGEADEYIEELQPIFERIEAILKEQGYSITTTNAIGFSLSAIFSLYLASQIPGFHSVIAVSPSAWYEGIVRYFKHTKMPDSIEAIYLSLGMEEADNNNDRIATVEERTQALSDIFLDQGIEVFTSIDEGDHFDAMHLRMAEGIRWSVAAKQVLQETD